MPSVSYIVRLGHSPMPFFQEVPAIAWGDRTDAFPERPFVRFAGIGPRWFDSEGDCRWPTDRAWTELDVSPRIGPPARLGIGPSDADGSELKITADHEQDARLAALLIAIRTGGQVVDSDNGAIEYDELIANIDDIAGRIARVARIREAYLKPHLEPWWPASRGPNGYPDR